MSKPDKLNGAIREIAHELAEQYSWRTDPVLCMNNYEILRTVLRKHIAPLMGKGKA